MEMVVDYLWLNSNVRTYNAAQKYFAYSYIHHENVHN